MIKEVAELLQLVEKVAQEQDVGLANAHLQKFFTSYGAQNQTKKAWQVLLL